MATQLVAVGGRVEWLDPEPADLLFTGGGGLVGAAIRAGSPSPFAHVGMLHWPVEAGTVDDGDLPPERARDATIRRALTGGGRRHVPAGVPVEHRNIWRTAEAFPPRLDWHERDLSTVSLLARVWRTDAERDRMLAVSEELTEAGTPYAYGEIASIMAAKAGRLLGVGDRWVPVWDNPGSVICSNHVAQCIRGARPDDYGIYFRFGPSRIWPGAVSEDSARLVWADTAVLRRRLAALEAL